METETLDPERRLLYALRDKGWDMTAQPTKHRPSAGSTWENSLHYVCTLTAPDCAPFTLFFSAGYGIPAGWAVEQARKGGGAWKKLRDLAGPVRHQDVLDLPSDRRRDTVFQRELREQIEAAWRPSLVDIVSSIFLDASGFPTTFRDWCEDWVTGEVNPADALRTFQSCEEAYLWLRKAAGSDLAEWYEIASEL